MRNGPCRRLKLLHSPSSNSCSGPWTSTLRGFSSMPSCSRDAMRPSVISHSAATALLVIWARRFELPQRTQLANRRRDSPRHPSRRGSSASSSAFVSMFSRSNGVNAPPPRTAAALSMHHVRQASCHGAETSVSAADSNCRATASRRSVGVDSPS